MPNPNHTLTEQQIAAIAAGATIGDAQASAGQDDAAAAAAAQAATDAAAAAATEAQAASAAEGAQAAAGEGAGAEGAQAEAQADVGKPDNEVVKFLQAEIKDRDAAALELNIQVRNLTAQVTSMEATHTGLLAIARDSVSKMQIALGGRGGAYAAADAMTVLAAHKDVAEKFDKQFKVGGVAATAAGQSDDEARITPANVTPIEAARARAVRITPSK